MVGVEARLQGERVHLRATHGVILAAGDYASGAELIGRYKGDDFRRIEGINPHATGDGHYLVTEAGGALVNMDVTYGPELRFVSPAGRAFQQLLPTGRRAARWMAAATRMLPKWIMSAFIKRFAGHLAASGRRLVHRRRHPGESRGPEDLPTNCNRRGGEIDVASQPDKQAFILLDGRLIERYSAWPHFISTAPDIAYAYVNDYRRLRSDVTEYGRTLSDVVRRRGIPAPALQQTLDAFNGADREPGRRYLRPLGCRASLAGADPGRCWAPPKPTSPPPKAARL